MPRQPSVVDKHVGARLRAARLEAGKSQTQVAEALGVTFQQVQKYEKGTNRISAGTLHELSRLLDTPVQFFFDGLGCRWPARQQGGRPARSAHPLRRHRGGQKSGTAFERADPEVRRLLAQMLDPRDEAVDEIREALAAYRATGARFQSTYHLILVAQALAACGRYDEGLSALREAAALVDRFHESCHKRGIHCRFKLLYVRCAGL